MTENVELKQRIERAKELLRTVRHAAMATVNIDGSPHNSPVFISFDDELRAVWTSSPEAQHSQNIARTGQVFIVLFDALGSGGGLYIQAHVVALQQPDLSAALETLNAARQRLLRESIPAGYFSGAVPQRLYRATPEKLWVNMSKKDTNGHIVQDTRHEVYLWQLIGAKS